MAGLLNPKSTEEAGYFLPNKGDGFGTYLGLASVHQAALSACSRIRVCGEGVAKQQALKVKVKLLKNQVSGQGINKFFGVRLPLAEKKVHTLWSFRT